MVNEKCSSPLVLILLVALGSIALAKTVAVSRMVAEEARQAVAVDRDHFYAIDNAAIGKYTRETGRRVAQWRASEEAPLVHLNSGVVRDGRLYSGHSN